MDAKKFASLATLVREAREADAAALLNLEVARAEWKSANEVLTDRMKVFDEYVNSAKSEAIALKKNE